ncbi:MAG: (d)CMP kinase [Candidatus Bipolaricaulia bacterium]
MKIAIDGPAAAGKTTLAKRLADRLGFLYIDTGAMYRAVAWGMLNGIELEEMQLELTEDGRVFLTGEEITNRIRSERIDELSSQISERPEVRTRLREIQRRMAEDRDVIMEGRDIGTVVLPDADLKIFLTALVETRARRRYEERLHQGEHPDYQEILSDIRARDQRDRRRQVSPLKKASDAVIIDTNGKELDRVVEEVLTLIHKGGE